MVWFQRSLLTNDPPFVPSGAKRPNGRFGVWIAFPPIRHALPIRQPDFDEAS